MRATLAFNGLSLLMHTCHVSRILPDFHTFFPKSHLHTHCKMLSIIQAFSNTEKESLFIVQGQISTFLRS